MPRKKGVCKTRLEYLLFLFLIGVISRTPAFLKPLQFHLLVFFLKAFDRRHHRILTTNIQLSFPEMDSRQQQQLAAAIYRHFFRVLGEMASAFAGKPLQPILDKSRFYGAEHMRRALAKKKGVLCFTAHFGNWEWLPLLLQTNVPVPLYVIARPMDNPRIEERVSRFRQRLGSRVIYKQGSLRKILEVLRKNEIIGILIDQNTVQREGVPIDFFSRKAYAVTTVSQLALKLGIPVVPFFTHYEGDEIIAEVLPEVDYHQSGDWDQDILHLTQRMNAIIEEQVRRFPEQWLWFHDRWKTKSTGDNHATGIENR